MEKKKTEVLEQNSIQPDTDFSLASQATNDLFEEQLGKCLAILQELNLNLPDHNAQIQCAMQNIIDIKPLKEKDSVDLGKSIKRKYANKEGTDIFELFLADLTQELNDALTPEVIENALNPLKMYKSLCVAKQSNTQSTQDHVYIEPGQIIIPGAIALAHLREYHSATNLEFKVWCAKRHITPLARDVVDESGYISITYATHCDFIDSYFLQSELEKFDPPSALRILSAKDLKKRSFWQKRKADINNLLLLYMKEGKLRIYSKDGILAWTQVGVTPLSSVYAEWPPRSELRDLLRSNKYYVILYEVEAIEDDYIKKAQSIIIKSPAKQQERLTDAEIVSKYWNMLYQELISGNITNTDQYYYINKIFELGKVAGEWDLVKRHATGHSPEKIKSNIKNALSKLKFQEKTAHYKRKRRKISTVLEK